MLGRCIGSPALEMLAPLTRHAMADERLVWLVCLSDLAHWLVNDEVGGIASVRGVYGPVVALVGIGRGRGNGGCVAISESHR